jgi:hypothetical protein
VVILSRLQREQGTWVAGIYEVHGSRPEILRWRAALARFVEFKPDWEAVGDPIVGSGACFAVRVFGRLGHASNLEHRARGDCCT